MNMLDFEVCSSCRGRDAPDERPATPKEQPAPFVPQDLWRSFPRDRSPGNTDYQAIVGRALVFGCPVAIAALAAAGFHDLLATAQSPPLALFAAGLLGVIVFWIALGDAVALAGFYAVVRRAKTRLLDHCDQLPNKLSSRIAIVMPVFAESPSRVFGAAVATLHALAQEGVAEHFDFFVLSDTIDPSLWADEERFFDLARARLSDRQQLYYRRRPVNLEKKHGNIADWCRRWGGGYDYMIVFDADTLMSGKTLVRLAKAMEHNPGVAVIQAPCMMINRETLFGRWMQFQNRVFGYWSDPVSWGKAYWHRGRGTFSGHNAIVRMGAFVQSAGLPCLSGRPPFGGYLLSHDIVEGALMSSAGWELWLVPEIDESYEEAPPTFLDWAIRERRWCQGELQHCRLFAARGLRWYSRLHLSLFTGLGLSGVIWALALATLILLAVQPDTGNSPQSYLAPVPNDLSFDRAKATELILLMCLLILLPRVLGYALVAGDKRRRAAFGGFGRLCVSALFEIFLAVLFFNLRMAVRLFAYVAMIMGRDSGWRAARRDDLATPTVDFLRFQAPYATVGAALAVVSFGISTTLFVWLLPVTLTLVGSGPLSAACAGRSGGQWLNCFTTPEERVTPSIVESARRYRNSLTNDFSRAAPE